MSPKTPKNAPLTPSHALLTPTWMMSLSLMALNDHVLKGAGLLPEALTGKLSDVAGMLVAPSLLATLTRTKTTRGLLACHAAVAAVFAGINVSHGLADLWSRAMGLVGMPWSITTDPTDLLVLPLMPLCWALTVPAMRRGYRAWHDSSVLAPAARMAAVGLGTFACIATSPPDDGGWDGELNYESIQADVYVHNTSGDQQLILRVRPLRPEIQIDCFNVSQNPGLYLQEQVFGEAFTWTMPPGTTAAVSPNGPSDAACQAVLLESDMMNPAIVFWQAGDVAWSTVPGNITSSNEYNNGAIRAQLGAVGERGTFMPWAAPSMVYDPQPVSEEVAPTCERIDPVNRLAYSPHPTGDRELLAIEPGIDGCYALTTTVPASEEPDPYPFYLCLPEIEFPFEVGDVVDVSNFRALTLDLRSRQGIPVEEGGEIRLQVATGSPYYDIDGLQVSSVATPGCELVPENECGTAARRVNPVAQYADSDPSDAPVGSAVVLTGTAGETATVFVTFAEEFAVTHSDCYLGPSYPATDIEYAAVIRGPLAN